LSWDRRAYPIDFYVTNGDTNLSTWIFQGNPKYFRVTAYLGSRNDILWETRQNRHLITEGDTVYLWRADAGDPGSGGVIARGIIAGFPILIDDVDALEFYSMKFKAHAHMNSWRVKIRIDSLHLAKPVLSRNAAMGDPLLMNMYILRVSVKTNYLLTPSEANRLDEIYRDAEREKTASGLTILRP
jgi:5-methylcytosine-specific restriction enzyme A